MSAEKENVKDTLGQRMKMYESNWNFTVLDLTKPIYARLDGRHFSSFTRHFGYPYSDLMGHAEETHGKYYDDWFFNIMQKVAQALLDEFGADVVENHSDEISLGWIDGHRIPFEGQYFKLISNMASYAGATLMKLILDDCIKNETVDNKSFDIVYGNTIPSFDCRILNLPNVMELTNCFVWRQNDCVRGTINQYAQCFFSHKQLLGKTIADRLTMLEESGHGDYLKSEEFEHIKFGSFFKKENVEVPLVDEKYKKYNPGKTTIIRSRAVQFYPGRLSTAEDKVERLFGLKDYDE